MKTRESLYRARVTAILVALVTVANGLLLGAFYSDAERAVIGALKVGLESGRVLQDPYQLAIHLQGLESSGLIDCTTASRQLKEQRVVVYDSSFRGNCGGELRKLLLPVRTVEVVSSSGQPWSVSFQPTLKRSQLWSLAMANVLLAACLGAALGWYRALVQKRLREQQAEIEGFHLIQNVFTQIAHDVRAPLAALNAAASTLGPDAMDERQVLLSAIQRIRGIAQGLLEMKLYRPLPRPSPERIAPIPVPVEQVREDIEGIVAEKRSQHRNRPEIQLRFHSEPSANRLVSIDLLSLGRIVSNLIENSVESIKSAGAIEVRLSSARGLMLVEVCDDGSGIDAKILPRLGRAGATFGKAKGTGLGLYHARVYFESLGGNFRVDSELGKGTTVSLAAPLYQA
jgi:signal transduction histidine kinase